MLEHKWYLKQIERNHSHILVKDNNQTRLDLTSHSFYISSEVFSQVEKGKLRLEKGSKIVPDLFLYKVIYSNDYAPANDPDYNLRFPKKLSQSAIEVKRIVTELLFNRVLYELQYNKIAKAKIYIQKLQTQFPDFNLPNDFVDILQK